MIKRTIDILLSSIGLILLSPIFLLLIIISLFLLGRPVFFLQARPGRNEKIFQMIKFRTMKSAYDESGSPLPDSQRLTKYGGFLRATSLDELPELWNVLKGDMSLIGPRPLLEEYLPLYTPEQRRRHDVRPGITGWAQINGRNAISWEEKFELDLWYIDHQSFTLDLKIILLTIRKVLFRENINASDSVTMEKFKGKK